MLPGASALCMVTSTHFQLAKVNPTALPSMYEATVIFMLCGLASSHTRHSVWFEIQINSEYIFSISKS